MQGIKNTYFYLVTLPDRLYPFKNEVNGELVRGRLSYKQALDSAFLRYGMHHWGYKLMLYRELFHFLGSLLFIVAAAVLSSFFFSGHDAVYVLLGAAVVALAVQEFYLHPKLYEQPTLHGVLDWLTWVVPMAAYSVFFLR